MRACLHSFIRLPVFCCLLLFIVVYVVVYVVVIVVDVLMRDPLLIHIAFESNTPSTLFLFLEGLTLVL